AIFHKCRYYTCGRSIDAVVTHRLYNDFAVSWMYAFTLVDHLNLGDGFIQPDYRVQRASNSFALLWVVHLNSLLGTWDMCTYYSITPFTSIIGTLKLSSVLR